jgi:hypothetical protein
MSGTVPHRSGVRVGLCSGDVFHVAASLEQVEAFIGRYVDRPDLVRIGGRSFSPQHVAMLTFEPHISSVEVLEPLDAADAGDERPSRPVQRRRFLRRRGR